jgi:hypothetical protein
MSMHRTLLAAVALLACLTLAHADEPKANPMPKPVGTPASVHNFGRENPDCDEWTNACQVCKRDATGAAQCSTVGIACTPGIPICRAKKAP